MSANIQRPSPTEGQTAEHATVGQHGSTLAEPENKPAPEGATCKRCGEWKPRAKFTGEPRKRNGLASWCRDCQAAHADANCVGGVPSRDTKRLGVFAVNKVMNALIAAGFRPTKTDFAYDLLVEAKGQVLRVEVKTGSRQKRPGLYQVKMCGRKLGKQVRYTRAKIDYLVAYVQKPGGNAYFVFPPGVFEGRIAVYLSIDGSCLWEQYRDAWHLLGTPPDAPLFEALYGQGKDTCQSSNTTVLNVTNNANES